MEFEWDESKRQETLRDRGLDFVSAYRFFDGRPIVVVPTLRATEMRWKSTTRIEEHFYTLVWTWRAERVRIISFRRAHRDEEGAYRSLHG